MGRWISCDLDSQIKEGPACYAVYVDDQLVYVGQSSRVRNRLLGGHRFNYSRYSSHVDTPWGQARTLAFKIRYSRKFGDWLVAEARLIPRLHPKYNRLGVR